MSEENVVKTEKKTDFGGHFPVKSLGNVSTLLDKFTSDLDRGSIAMPVLRSAVLNSVRKNPLLLKCTQASFLSSLMYCSDTGLVPDTPAQECHLIPFNNKDGMAVTWVAGWRGLSKLARENGDILKINPEVVFKSDEFSFRKGLHEDLIHVPDLDNDRTKDEDITHFYAIAWYANKAVDFEIMTKAQVDQVRSRAKAKNGDAWVYHYAEQGRKTVIKRLCKRLPMSLRLARAVELDNTADFEGMQDHHPTVETEYETDPGKSRTENLAEKVHQKAQQTAGNAPGSNSEPSPSDIPESPETPPQEPEQPQEPQPVTGNVSPQAIAQFISEIQDLIPVDELSDLRKKYTIKRLEAFTPEARWTAWSELQEAYGPLIPEACEEAEETGVEPDGEGISSPADVD